MDHLSLLLGVLAAAVHTTAYVLYNLQTLRGQSKPNAATWGLWAFLIILNALTYRETSHSFWLAFAYYTSSTACVLTFLLLLMIGKLEWPAWRDWLYAGLAGIGGLVWIVFHRAEYANLIITAAILLSFEPTYRLVWADPRKETSRSWLLWTLAFAIITVNVAVKRGSLYSYISPISLLIAHYVVVVLCSSKRKARFAIRLALPTTPR